MNTDDLGIKKNESSTDSSWLKRVGWLIVIWALSVLALGVVAFAIKKFMTAAGMTT